MNLHLTIEYPETFPNALGQTRMQFEHQAKWAMAVKLFELTQSWRCLNSTSAPSMQCLLSPPR